MILRNVSAHILPGSACVTVAATLQARHPRHLVTGHSIARHRRSLGCERGVLQIQDAQHLVRCLRAADRRGVRYSALGGCDRRDASMQTGAMSIALRSLPILWSCALSHDRPEFFASPSRTGQSWEPPVAVRARVHAPVRSRKATRHLALQIIRETSGRPSCEKARDLPVGVSLPGLQESIEDAP